MSPERWGHRRARAADRGGTQACAVTPAGQPSGQLDWYVGKLAPLPVAGKTFRNRIANFFSQQDKELGRMLPLSRLRPYGLGGRRDQPAQAGSRRRTRRDQQCGQAMSRAQGHRLAPGDPRPRAPRTGGLRLRRRLHRGLERGPRRARGPRRTEASSARACSVGGHRSTLSGACPCPGSTLRHLAG